MLKNNLDHDMIVMNTVDNNTASNGNDKQKTRVLSVHVTTQASFSLSVTTWRASPI